MQYGVMVNYTEGKKSESLNSNTVINHFDIKRNGKLHQIRHAHFLGWPDLGVPDNLEDLTDVLTLILNEIDNTGADQRILIHCG